MFKKDFVGVFSILSLRGVATTEAINNQASRLLRPEYRARNDRR
jgi:hypothetical protein